MIEFWNNQIHACHSGLRVDSTRGARSARVQSLLQPFRKCTTHHRKICWTQPILKKKTLSDKLLLTGGRMNFVLFSTYICTALIWQRTCNAYGVAGVQW